MDNVSLQARLSTSLRQLDAKMFIIHWPTTFLGVHSLVIHVIVTESVKWDMTLGWHFTRCRQRPGVFTSACLSQLCNQLQVQNPNINGSQRVCRTTPTCREFWQVCCETDKIIINPWRHSSDEPRPTEEVAAKWQYRDLELTKLYPSTLISVFLTGFRYFSYQVTTQLSSWGWVDPFQTLYFQKNFLGIAGNRTRDLWDGSQTISNRREIDKLINQLNPWH